MMFASDLDRTLIYSKVFLEGLTAEECNQIELVETLEGREISYMTKDAIRKIKELQKHMLVIPTTTRTIAQYQRIHLFSQTIRPKYAVTSNGGNILVNGEVDKVWQEHIRQSMTRDSVPYGVLMNEMKGIKGSWILREYMADDLFGYMIVDPSCIPHTALKEFKIFVEENNWSMSLQGRKLYFVPSCVNKGKAIRYIAEKEKIKTIIGAGDSLLDLPLIDAAGYSIIPPHGELHHVYGKELKSDSEYCYTVSNGIYAAEEILDKVKSRIA